MTSDYSAVDRIMLRSGHGFGHLMLRLLILASLVCGILAECGGLLVYENFHPVDSDKICIKRYKTTECIQFVRSYDQKDLPADYPRRPTGIDKPEDLHLSSIKYVIGQKVHPGIGLIWKSPLSVTARENLLGFLIVWHSRLSNILLCNLLLFNTSNEYLKKSLTFEYQLQVQERSLFTVEVHSMPTHPVMVSNGFAVSSIVTPAIYSLDSEEVDPGKWIPYITASVFDNGTVIIKFTLPPAKYHLTRFQVMVFELGDFANPVHRVDYRPGLLSPENTHGRQVFQMRKSGCYRVIVRVREEDGNWLVEGRCRCWAIVLTHKRCVSSCGSVYVNLCLNVTGAPSIIQPGGITRVPGVPSESPTQAVSSNMAEAVVTGIISATLFLMFIFCIAFCLKHVCVKKKHRKGSGKPKDVNNSWSDSDPAKSQGCAAVPLAEKLVYIIYARDHQPHVQLVEALIAFLNVHCHCRVISLMPFDGDESEKYQWFLSRISSADYIIFLNSRAAESLIVAYLNMKLCRTKPASLEDDLFLLGVRYLMQSEIVRENKLILVSFNGKCCQKYLQVSVVYTLPNDLLGLLQKLHNFSKENTEAYDKLLPLYVENIPSLPEGARLLSAIKAEEDFEESNPGWFPKKFGLLKLLSEDAGYSSDVTSNTGVSVQDQMPSECDSPGSDLEKLDFAASLHADDPTRPQTPPHVQSCTDSCCPEKELSEMDLPVVADKLNMEGIIDQFHKLSKVLEHVHMETKPLDGESFIPPETLSEITYDTYSTALAQINTHGEVLSPITQSQIDCVEKGSNKDLILKGAEFIPVNELKLSPPETLSNVQEENMSACFRDINESTEKYLNGI
ncbi:unnamed protein product [Candidula unifasciata]|uniref:SEFIR domain-containing protein n=1 Tax=Candidula unifasciata TaxID=100452 RepID=A0A8S4A3A4_9EUPU|nr:unnamed protein product [Candidula unifasciata]